MNFLSGLAPHVHWGLRLSLAATFIYHGITKFPIEGPLLGMPVAVAGAMPGDMLEVRIRGESGVRALGVRSVGSIDADVSEDIIMEKSQEKCCVFLPTG